jgi:hypothetical protein
MVCSIEKLGSYLPTYLLIYLPTYLLTGPSEQPACLTPIISLCQSLQANNSLSHLSLFQTIQGKKYFIGNSSFTRAPSSSIEKLVIWLMTQLWMNPNCGWILSHLSLSFKLSKEGSSSLPVFHSLVHPFKVGYDSVVDESHPTGLLLGFHPGNLSCMKMGPVSKLVGR